MAIEDSRQFFRLTPEAYKQLEREANPAFVTDKNTELQAGFLLGQQHILAKLRDGFVIGA